MDTANKTSRSTTRKTLSFLGKVALVMMGEPIPATHKNNAQQKPLKKRPFYLRVFLILLKLPLFVLIAGLQQNKKRYKPTLQERMIGERIPMSDKYYIPDDKY